MTTKESQGGGMTIEIIDNSTIERRRLPGTTQVLPPLKAYLVERQEVAEAKVLVTPPRPMKERAKLQWSDKYAGSTMTKGIPQKIATI